jgi:P27 family predicted phage terminase small subunit
MTKGRKPYETAVKEASGYYQKDPQRRNPLEPKPAKGRPEPTHFILSNETAMLYWNEYCDRLEELGVMAVCDARLLEQLCIDHIMRDEAIATMSEGGVTVTLDNGKPMARPEFAIYRNCSDRIMRCLSLFGLTPSDRSRLCVNNVEEKDPFEQWLEADDS